MGCDGYDLVINRRPLSQGRRTLKHFQQKRRLPKTKLEAFSLGVQNRTGPVFKTKHLWLVNVVGTSTKAEQFYMCRATPPTAQHRPRPASLALAKAEAER
jgi:hypothetical protein